MRLFFLVEHFINLGGIEKWTKMRIQLLWIYNWLRRHENAALLDQGLRPNHFILFISAIFSVFCFIPMFNIRNYSAYR